MAAKTGAAVEAAVTVAMAAAGNRNCGDRHQSTEFSSSRGSSAVMVAAILAARCNSRAGSAVEVTMMRAVAAGTAIIKNQQWQWRKWQQRW